MKSADCVPIVLIGSVGIAVGHAMACLPIALQKAYEVGEIGNWFRAWQLFVFVLGLPGLIVIEIPSALVVYVICYTTKADCIHACAHRLYMGALLVSSIVGTVSAFASESLIRGLISGVSPMIYFGCIIETARYCAANRKKY